MVSVNYQEQNTGTDQYLRSTQLIIDAFTKALDQNECTVKMLVGTHEQISEQVKTLTDIVDATSNNGIPSNTVFNKDNTTLPTSIDQIVFSDQKVTKEEVSAIKARLKNRCIDCNLKLPKLNFSNNIQFSLGKLKASLQIYADTFNQLTNPNFCQASTVFNFACLQDLIKLIALFLSVFTAILGLKKLSNISIKGLIRGVISGLLGILIGKINLQLDASQTGIKCLIDAIKQLALRIPDGESLNGYMDKKWFDDNEKQQQELLKNTSISEDKTKITVPNYELFTDERGNTQKRITGFSTLSTGLEDITSSTTTDNTTKNNEPFFNQDKLKSALNDLSNSNNINYIKQFANAMEKDASDYEKIINNSFKYIGDTVDKVIEGFNEEISKIFGLLEYFQCELSRTGTDFMEILDFMNRIINVVNLLSSIAGVLAKKQIKKLCKSKDSTYDLSEQVKKELKNQPNDLDPVDIIGDYMGKVVDKTVDSNDKIIPLIYDKPSDPILPKLSFETCNLKEFLEAHTVDNIIEKAIDSIREDERKASESTKDKDIKLKNTDDPSSFKYNNTTFQKSNINPLKDTVIKDSTTPTSEDLDVVNNRRWNLYPIQYAVPKLKDDNGNPIGTLSEEDLKELNKNTDKSFGVNTILDFIYNNPTDLIKTNKNNSEDTDTSPSLHSNTTELETPKYSDYTPNSDSYLNKCRSIEDVLSVLEKVKG